MDEKNKSNIAENKSSNFAKRKLKKKLPVLIVLIVVLLFSVAYGLIFESCFLQDIVTPNNNDVDVKPVIYLYPKEETDIRIDIPTVVFTTTYPLYDNGWSVTAYPNGVLTNNEGREHNYLYWEGYTNYKVDLSEGFVVAKGDYIDFLEEKLEYVGLSDKEACDFISYWLPIMNEHAYCLLSFQKDYGEKVKIEYSIKPDNELVVFVAFKGLDEPIQIEEQDLSVYKGFKREGFVSVEWGGRVVN